MFKQMPLEPALILVEGDVKNSAVAAATGYGREEIQFSTPVAAITGELQTDIGSEGSFVNDSLPFSLKQSAGFTPAFVKMKGGGDNSIYFDKEHFKTMDTELESSGMWENMRLFYLSQGIILKKTAQTRVAVLYLNSIGHISDVPIAFCFSMAKSDCALLNLFLNVANRSAYDRNLFGSLGPPKHINEEIKELLVHAGYACDCKLFKEFFEEANSSFHMVKMDAQVC